MKNKGLRPETVTLAHGAKGHWIGNPSAKKVIIYYHGADPLRSPFIMIRE